MHYNFPGHEEENILGLCFNQTCPLDPLFCYYCKEKEHSSHQNECIRFDVLNQSIVDIHNTLLQQISACFRNLDSNFAKKMQECQQLHKILQSKKYDEAKANINMIQQYQYFDQDKLKQYIHQIQGISEELMNQFNQISIVDQNDRFSKSHIIEKSDDNPQGQQEDQFQVIDQQQQIPQIGEQQEFALDDDDKALLQLVLKESQEEEYLQNIQKSENFLSQAKQNLSNFNYAMPLIEQSISFYNNNDEALFIKNILRINKLAQLLLDQQNKEEALKYLNKVLEVNPSHVNPSVQLAQILFEQNKLNEAEKIYFEAIKKNPDISKLYSLRGIFKKIFDDQTPYIIYFLNFQSAKILNNLGRFNEAITMCDQAIKIDNSNASAYNNKGLQSIEISQFITIQKIKNNHIQVIKVRGALTIQDMAIKLQENNPDYLANKGQILLKMKKVIEAQGYLDKIKQSGQKNAHIMIFKCEQYLLNLGEILIAQQKFQEALQEYKNLKQLKCKIYTNNFLKAILESGMTRQTHK